MEKIINKIAQHQNDRLIELHILSYNELDDVIKIPFYNDRLKDKRILNIHN